MKFSNHFINDVKPKRPYFNEDLLQDILRDPIKKEIQENGRVKYGDILCYTKNLLE